RLAGQAARRAERVSARRRRGRGHRLHPAPPQGWSERDPPRPGGCVGDSPLTAGRRGSAGRVEHPTRPAVPAIRIDYECERRFWPTARISEALPILERPSMPSLAASRCSSLTVSAPAPLPVPFEAPRLRAAALAPSRPSAVRVFFGSFVIVFFRRAADCAFFTFLRAAWRCFCVATGSSLP